jgi:hypothetical protein
MSQQKPPPQQKPGQQNPPPLSPLSPLQKQLLRFKALEQYRADHPGQILNARLEYFGEFVSVVYCDGRPSILVGPGRPFQTIKALFEAEYAPKS